MDGTPFGRYHLVELLGRGGMGEVWRAFDTVTNRTVAIKLLPPQLAQDDEFVARFRREAEMAAQLSSPHIIPIHDYGEIDGRLFVDMRLIEGRDLHAVLAGGRLEPALAVHIVEQVAKALHAGHKVGLIHRDVKPSNILLDDDFAYLIDFGIARALDETRLTKSGNTIGTMQYIAPERLGSRTQEDARVDVYSLACVLYECLTGLPPFAGNSMAHLVAAHLNTPPPQPSVTKPDLPAELDEVILTGMAKDPDQRYATTLELADAARAAITVPIHQPTSDPALRSATELAPYPGSAQPKTIAAPALAPAGPAAPQPAPRTSTTAGGISRRTRITLVVGVIALVGGIAAAIGITTHGEHRSSGPSLTSSPPPTSSDGSYAAQAVLPFTGLQLPTGMAVDGAGNVYVTDFNKNNRDINRVLKLAAGSSTPTALPFTGLNEPYGVAADGAGNLYVTDTDNDRVLKLAAGSSTQSVLPFIGIKTPEGVAVDSTGTLYVTDLGNNRVLKLAAGSSTQRVLPFTDLNEPRGVAVDGAGNVYVTDFNNDRVLKLAAGSSTQRVLPFTGIKGPEGVAVDSTGTLYVASLYSSQVLKLAAGSSTPTVLPFTGLQSPWGVAVDGNDTLYVVDSNNSRVLKLSRQ